MIMTSSKLAKVSVVNRDEFHDSLRILAARLSVTLFTAWTTGLAEYLAANLDLAAAEQARRFGGGARGKRLTRKKFAIGGIHRIKVSEVGEVDLDLYHVFAGELQFVEYVADGGEHRARFGGYIAEHGDSCGEISRDQAGQKGVVLVQHYLAKGGL